MHHDSDDQQRLLLAFEGVKESHFVLMPAERIQLVRRQEMSECHVSHKKPLTSFVQYNEATARHALCQKSFSFNKKTANHSTLVFRMDSPFTILISTCNRAWFLWLPFIQCFHGFGWSIVVYDFFLWCCHLVA